MNASSGKTTPAPWHIGLPGGPAGPFYSLVNSRGNVVALQIVTEADAVLMRTAPELYDALVDLIADAEHYRAAGATPSTTALNRARAAIADADREAGR